jgi:competence protein ComFC
LFDLLFPRRCLGCAGRPWPFCAPCLSRVGWLGRPGCQTCGRPLETIVRRCADCPPAVISWARSAFLYEGPVRHALMRLKFGGQKSAADPLGAFMLEALQRAPPEVNPSDVSCPVLTWVPLGRKRRRDRGYDQAEALARVVGELSGLPVRQLLARSVETGPQARRSGPARRLALRGAFRAVNVPAARVILVDDVLTSGATAAECATVLRQAGALEIGVLTAARSLGGPVPAR